MIGLFELIKKKSILLELKFSQVMKIYNVFHANLLQKALIHLLAAQLNELIPLIIMNNKEKWTVEDILDTKSF